MKKVVLSLALLASFGLSAALPDAGAHARKFRDGLGHGEEHAGSVLTHFLVANALHNRSVKERAITVGVLVGGGHAASTKGGEVAESLGRGVAAAGVEYASDVALPHLNRLVDRVPGSHYVSNDVRGAVLKSLAHTLVQVGISAATSRNADAATDGPK